MSAAFIVISVVTLASGIAAMLLRNLVHCALSLSITFAGLAALYLQLDAQFVGFAQLLVYVGAVAILIVFAILLTRGSEPHRQSVFASHWLVGIGVAVAVFEVVAGVIFSSTALARLPVAAPEVSVRQLGDQLMTKYVLPLELLGLLLTAALIGAVILAMPEGEPKRPGGAE